MPPRKHTITPPISPVQAETIEEPSAIQVEHENVPELETIFDARHWKDKGWTAQVIKNDDEEGWAVAMYKDGELEPALVGPWTMGRDKKNPKPLDPSAFNTLVKTASEVLRRHEQQLHARLHKSMYVFDGSQEFRIMLDIVADEEAPYGTLRAFSQEGVEVATNKVAASFSLNKAAALEWIKNDFRMKHAD